MLLFGPSQSGKSFTLRGGEGKSRGVVLRSVECLLNECSSNNWLLKVVGV